MFKILITLLLFMQFIFVQFVFAEEYNISEAGFKLKIPKQEINIFSKDFYGGLQPNGDFIYVYSLDEKQASRLIGKKFTTASFAEDYASIELLERSGIDPLKANLKHLDPQKYWPEDKPFIKPLPEDAKVSISTQRIHGKNSLNMQFSKKSQDANNSYLYSVNLQSDNDRLYIISTKTLINVGNVGKDSTESINNTHDIYIQGVHITKPKSAKKPLIYNDKLGNFKIDLPQDWYYVQSYFSDKPNACLTFALPLDTLKKIKEKTRNLEANDLDKEKLADNISEEDIASWMELITEGIWSVSCETKEFETSAYLENPEATKAELQLLFSELKQYLENSRYYKNSKFDFNVDITPKIGYINFNFSFNLKGNKDFDNSGRIFFTKNKAGIVVYTSTIKNTEQQNTSKLLNAIKKLDFK